MIVTSFDNTVLLGDFNIHVCCPLKPLAREFLKIIDSLKFSQCITRSTHQHGHTLDLVIYMGIPVCNIQILDHYFSDHNPIVFNITILCSPPNNNLLLIMLVQLQLQVSDFSSVFYAYSLIETIESPSILMGPE